MERGELDWALEGWGRRDQWADSRQTGQSLGCGQSGFRLIPPSVGPTVPQLVIELDQVPLLLRGSDFPRIMPLLKYFNCIATADGPSYVCLICNNARPTKDYRRHSRRYNHQVNIARHEEAELIRRHDDVNYDNIDVQPDILDSPEGLQGRARTAPASAEGGVATVGPSLPGGFDLSSGPSGENSGGLRDTAVPVEEEPALPEDLHNDDDGLYDLLNAEGSLSDNGDGTPGNSGNRGGATAAEPMAQADWFPFRNKMIRGILRLCDMQIPDWGTVRDSRARIRDITQSTDLGNPLVSPHLEFYPDNTEGQNVSRFSQSLKWLQYMAPEDRAQMCDVNDKHFYIFEPVQLLTKEVVVPIFLYMYHWRLHAKCIEIGADHVTELGEQTRITIPSSLAFDDHRLTAWDIREFDLTYSEIRMGDGILLTEACGGSIYDSDGLVDREIPLPNHWRTVADGKVIRNVPVTLYCDDTSGNTSKQFNKHVSFYFTLSGLPPHVSNQEFNCHFLSTSNIGSALEIAEQVVDEFNEMGTKGYGAYDASIGQSVWVMSTVLCFLADSPMHAEITNTPNPGQSLNPCRVCTLSCEKKSMKTSREYVQRFLGLDNLGILVPNAMRSWDGTRMETKRLFSVARSVNMTQFKKQCLASGIKDAINIRLLTDAKTSDRVNTTMEELQNAQSNRLYNAFLKLHGFDGVLDTPVEVLHVVLLGIVKYLARDFIKSLSETVKLELIARLRSFNCNALNIDSLKPNYLIRHILSIVGRDFKVILQCAPFVFFDYMTEEKRKIWSALCRLSPFIFQTSIADMGEYQIQLKLHIDIFLYHLISSTAQWVNKPKIHMLRHLPEAILRFGPASLCSTEKFESYNGVLRKASVHSNKLAPGRDIALTFNSYACIKFWLSGGYLIDRSTGLLTRASSQVRQAFDENPNLQESLGYNASATFLPGRDEFPACHAGHYRLQSTFNPPASLVDLAATLCRQRERLILRRKRGSPAVRGLNGSCMVGEVDSIWEVDWGYAITYHLDVVGFDVDGYDEHYDMTRIARTGYIHLVNATDVAGAINVQHNCHGGGCQLDRTGSTFRERILTEDKCDEVQHSDIDHFLINAASLHNPGLHQQMSLPAALPISPSDWRDAISLGLEVWGHPNEPGLDSDDSDDMSEATQEEEEDEM
ncbi:uncharacterized protein PGTG_22477 [Puccinia graminis f. sp. tritici CRL 75-36-700-3]|uniref:Uncharacterized protein n=1 Tax=Puccinia graminis f. sp. tritici (strain CRL 75-36-700-3 / race SCCL) TaxID=418459 RepID=H6QUP6_PUCGT|nr:uncharacterized protein PGTG_22477 [Puccinia graminis f. sp. tritici CRL 75-36-700-3]EHS64758.1 hypothetical protein PGTG_22477 [Puccinia graminis f. sp. tritici CRL 75-36-700-3]